MALKDRRAIAIDTILMKGIFCYVKKDFKNSKKIFETALLIEPTSAEAHNNLGVAQVEFKEYSQAIESFHYALHFAPSYWAARVNLAMTYELKGDLENSIKTFVTPCPAAQQMGLDEHTLLVSNITQNTLAENITRLQAENPLISVSLKTKSDYAYFLQLQGNTEAAIYSYNDARILADNKCLDLAPKKPEDLDQIAHVYANFAWTLTIAGKIDEALKYLKKSYSIYCRTKNVNTKRIQALIEYHQREKNTNVKMS